MRTSGKTAILMGLALALSLLPHTVSAQKSGFFFRGNVGFGYTTLNADDVGDTKIKGGSGMVALDFGTFFKDNVAVYGEIFGSSITGPELESGGVSISTSNDMTATLFGVGVGVTVYSASGVYFGGTVGMARMRLEYSSGSASVSGDSDMGLGLSVLVGKEWQVGNRWGLGVSGHGMTGRIKDSGDNWTPLAFGVDFTFTFVKGGYR
ncbi:MAG: porin family protein [Gemmatimonadetes bacterium]|nr:porin family protein [Gemmatimonadota bacterium]